MTPTSPDGKAPNNSNHSVHTPRRNNQQNKVENTNDSPEGSRKSGSRDRKPGSSGSKRLGEAVVQVMVYYLLNLICKFIFCSEDHFNQVSKSCPLDIFLEPRCKVEVQNGIFVSVFLFG